MHHDIITAKKTNDRPEENNYGNLVIPKSAAYCSMNSMQSIQPQSTFCIDCRFVIHLLQDFTFPVLAEDKFFLE